MGILLTEAIMSLRI